MITNLVPTLMGNRRCTSAMPLRRVITYTSRIAGANPHWNITPSSCGCSATGAFNEICRCGYRNTLFLDRPCDNLRDRRAVLGLNV